ncbi:hypothetical protein PINS_up003591 [Pythium insidiosum]|nr:hypothetical protein PINS_up003591 [Pythium insidiosum]
MEISAAALLTPQLLDGRITAMQSLHRDLEELLGMKSILLRTLQKNVASEFLDVEMQHQRTFIEFFTVISVTLPRLVPSLSVTTSNSGEPTEPQAFGARELRHRYKQYELMTHQFKATVAKFHALRDEIAVDAHRVQRPSGADPVTCNHFGLPLPSIAARARTLRATAAAALRYDVCLLTLRARRLRVALMVVVAP